ncbi:MAG: hypothetical protein HQM01_07005 [Magnetococcales bacterium]|nr:hypothetical protein [Magnetococcales bacterium]
MGNESGRIAHGGGSQFDGHVRGIGLQKAQTDPTSKAARSVFHTNREKRFFEERAKSKSKARSKD